jgi:hypothetical protein
MSILIACLWLHAASGAGQTVGTSTGAISGKVTDITGAALRDVRISVMGAALMGARNTTTAADGRYTVNGLPPGEYAIDFARDAFAAERREGVRVAIGFTAAINVEMQPATREERVTVVRERPILDTRSASLGATVDAAALAGLPGSRSMGSVFQVTPGIYHTRHEVGGTATPIAPFSAYGITGFNRPMLEGMIVSNILGFGLTLDYGALEEVSVGTGAFGVEWPSPGVQSQFTVRAGGNRYRGSVYADVEPRQWQAFNIDADQIARGAEGSVAVAAEETNRIWSYHDINADVGGFIRRDRIWWYGSVRQQRAATRLVNFPVVPFETLFYNYGGKLTAQVAPQHRAIAFVQVSQTDQPTRLDPFGPTGMTANTAIHQSAASTADSRAWGEIWKGEWNGTFDDRLFAEVRAGRFTATRRERPNGGGPRSEDIATLIVRGGGRDWQNGLQRGQVLGSVSSTPAARHFLKIGGEAVRQVSTDEWSAGYPGDVLHVFSGLRPASVYLLQTPSRSENGLWWYSAYASDTWQLDRLTITFGARVERYRVFLPAQQHPAGLFNPESQSFDAVDNLIDWNVVAPRFSLVWDATGDARTLLKATVGHYWMPPGSEVGAMANPNPNSWWRSHVWTDPDGSGAWEPGEEESLLDARGGVAVQSIDPNLQLPYVREVTAFFERELRPGAAIRTGVVWRGERQQFARQNVNQPAEAFSVSVFVPDPGPDGRAGTADDGPAVQAWQLDPALVGLPVQNILRNVPASASDWWTWELDATLRGYGRWSASGGFVHTWLREQANAYLGQNIRQNQYALNPNDYLHTDAAGRHGFRLWSLKAFATYTGPWDITITPFVRHQAGQPSARTIAATLNYTRTARLLVEPVGARRMDHVTLADLRIEKGFRMGAAGRVAGFLDLFNIFNANPEQATSWASRTFLQPLSIVPPRIARIGLKLSW